MDEKGISLAFFSLLLDLIPSGIDIFLGGVFHTMKTRHQTSAERTAGEELTSSGPLKSPKLANSDTDGLVVISEGRLTRSATRQQAPLSIQSSQSSPGINPKVFVRLCVNKKVTKPSNPCFNGEFLTGLEGVELLSLSLLNWKRFKSWIEDYLVEEKVMSKNEALINVSGNSQTPFFIRDSAPKSLMKKDAKATFDDMIALLPNEHFLTTLKSSSYHDPSQNRMTLDVWVLFGKKPEEDPSVDEISKPVKKKAKKSQSNADEEVDVVPHESLSLKVYVYPLVFQQNRHSAIELEKARKSMDLAADPFVVRPQDDLRISVGILRKCVGNMYSLWNRRVADGTRDKYLVGEESRLYLLPSDTTRTCICLSSDQILWGKIDLYRAKKMTDEEFSIHVTMGYMHPDDTQWPVVNDMFDTEDDNYMDEIFASHASLTSGSLDPGPKPSSKDLRTARLENVATPEKKARDWLLKMNRTPSSALFHSMTMQQFDKATQFLGGRNIGPKSCPIWVKFTCEDDKSDTWPKDMMDIFGSSELYDDLFLNTGAPRLGSCQADQDGLPLINHQYNRSLPPNAARPGNNAAAGVNLTDVVTGVVMSLFEAKTAKAASEEQQPSVKDPMVTMTFQKEQRQSTVAMKKSEISNSQKMKALLNEHITKGSTVLEEIILPSDAEHDKIEAKKATIQVSFNNMVYDWAAFKEMTVASVFELAKSDGIHITLRVVEHSGSNLVARRSLLD
jgi:hypothetical protein